MTPRPTKLAHATQRAQAMIKSDRVVVAAVLTVSRADVHRYSHLGLRFELDDIVVGAPALPPTGCGRCARRNLDGWEDKRTDLTKELREISNWAPNWHGSGYHLVSRIALIKRRDPNVHRIPHVRGWQSVVRQLLRR